MGLSPGLSPPDLFEYKFIDSRIINSTFLHSKEGCQLDFSDDNNAYMIYFVSFLGTLAVLPGNIVSALLMDKIGRLRMLGEGPPFWQMLGRDQPPLSAGRPGGGSHLRDVGGPFSALGPAVKGPTGQSCGGLV